MIAAAQPSVAAPSTVGAFCSSDTDCDRESSCVAPRGAGSLDVCVPTTAAASNADDEECVYQAICRAAVALRRACADCILEPLVSCNPIPADDAWYRKRWDRLEATCLKRTPEQDAAQKALSDFRKAPRDSADIMQPDLNLWITGWSIDVPISWAGSGDESGRLRLDKSKAKLSQALARLAEFNFLCPVFESEGNKTDLIAGICGGFRNPNPTKSPPRVRIRKP